MRSFSRPWTSSAGLQLDPPRLQCRFQFSPDEVAHLAHLGPSRRRQLGDAPEQSGEIRLAAEETYPGGLEGRQAPTPQRSR